MHNEARWCRPPVNQWSLLDLFFNDPATTEIYTLSLHDALPICTTRGFRSSWRENVGVRDDCRCCAGRDLCALTGGRMVRDRKSTRLNSSHVKISYAVFCLKKKMRHRAVCPRWYQSTT